MLQKFLTAPISHAILLDSFWWFFLHLYQVRKRLGQGMDIDVFHMVPLGIESLPEGKFNKCLKIILKTKGQNFALWSTPAPSVPCREQIPAPARPYNAIQTRGGILPPTVVAFRVCTNPLTSQGGICLGQALYKADALCRIPWKH